MSFNLIIYNLKAKVQKIFVITQKNADFFAEKGINKVFSWFLRFQCPERGDSFSLVWYINAESLL